MPESDVIYTLHYAGSVYTTEGNFQDTKGYYVKLRSNDVLTEDDIRRSIEQWLWEQYQERVYTLAVLVLEASYATRPS